MFFFLQSPLPSMGPTKPLINTNKDCSEIVSDEMEIRENKISWHVYCALSELPVANKGQ